MPQANSTVERSATMRLTFRQKGLSLAAAFAAASLFAAPALAQAAQATQVSTEDGIPTKWMSAIRGGIGINQTEGVVGWLWQSPAMVPSKCLPLRPAVTRAFSSGQFAVGMNLDVVAEAKIPGSSWSLIFGGGVSIF